MNWRKLSREDIANLNREATFITGGLTEEKIVHEQAVADICLMLADEMIKDGEKVDKKILEAGALLHDVGLAKVGISEIVRTSPEHSGWGGWLCRKWGFPDQVAECPESHEMWTPELAEKLGFPKPIQKSYFPRCIEAKIVHFVDGLDAWSIAYGEIDPWGNPESFMSIEDSFFLGTHSIFDEMVNANVGITKEMIEDRTRKLKPVILAIKKELFPYLKKEWFTKDIAMRRGHKGWTMGHWFPIAESVKKVINIYPDWDERKF